MNELVASIRADLTDRRLLPIVALVGLCFVAAIAYAVLGGSSSAPNPVASTSTPSVPTTGIAVTGATPEHAVAETTDGFKEQRGGTARNPFSLLVAPTPTGGSSGSSSGSSSFSSSSSSSSGSEASGEKTSGSSGGTSGGSGSSEKTETKTETKKPKVVYNVAIEFGALPPGTTPETAQLTPFSKLKLQTPLPSAQTPLLVFRGVTAKGKSATFTLVGEAILSGTGACLPSSTQCEAVDLKPGETEQLSYLAANGESTVYELRVLGISAEKATAKKASAGGWGESAAGIKVLRQSGLTALPYLHYSSQPGVLIFSPHKAHAAEAHTAVIELHG